MVKERAALAVSFAIGLGAATLALFYGASAPDAFASKYRLIREGTRFAR